MKPIYLVLISLSSLQVTAQGKVESCTTQWPAEYKWKVARRTNSEVYIIPGDESISTASIIGVIASRKGVRVPSIDSIISRYKAGLDTGSILTVLDQSHDSAHLWVLFKVETPKNGKYPEPESDLYYIAQGEFALFDTHVAIKSSSLPSDFIDKWGAILKESKIIKIN